MSVRDLEHKQGASDELRESERWFSEMLSNVALISMMLDRQANIEYCNDYLLNLTGWRREEVLGRSFLELFLPLDLPRGASRRLYSDARKLSRGLASRERHPHTLRRAAANPLE